MNVIKEDGAAPIKMWTEGVPVEDKALEQLKNVARMPMVHGHVAVMPDVHWGMGATIGSVIPTRGAIIPAAVGVDIGCFTGDTTVPTMDGAHRRLDELTRTDPFLVWAVSPAHRIMAATAAARLTRRDAELVRVILDNGESVRCTPDHRFMLRDGSFREARDLRANDSLMPFYSKSDEDGYMLVSQPYSGRWQRAHWIVARSGALGTIPRFDGQRTIIHHKNFNESDNRPENLEFMGDRDHASYHRLLVERNTHWQSEDFETKRVAALRAKAETPEGHKYFAERGTKNLRKYMAERHDHFVASVAGNGKRGSPFLSAYNRSEQGRRKSAEVASREYVCPHCGKVGKGGFFFPNHIARCHDGASAPNNHKVVSVETLSEREDVYCLTVPGYENFALSCGVFVHNCGMIAQRTTLTASDLPDNLHGVRSAIEAAIPHGRTDNGGVNDRGSWGEPPPSIKGAWDLLRDDFDKIIAKHPKLAHRRVINQLCSLGTGNHFIEVCLDKEDRVWVMLHSGSRGVGGLIGGYFIERAKRTMEKFFIKLPDKDLSYLPEDTEDFDDYMRGVGWAQNYARMNRELMMSIALDRLFEEIGKPFSVDVEAINCHHNYVSKEHHFGDNVWVTRKGAVRAREGEFGIIPGSMGARSFIVRGKGNLQSFQSCSHGAGRKMSRTEAKRRFTLEDHAKATASVECRKDADVIDESPGAYKDIQAVIDAQSDLIEVVYELKQVVCVKG